MSRIVHSNQHRFYSLPIASQDDLASFGPRFSPYSIENTHSVAAFRINGPSLANVRRSYVSKATTLPYAVAAIHYRILYYYGTELLMLINYP